MSRIAGTLAVQFVGDFSRLKQEYQVVIEELRKTVVPVSLTGTAGPVSGSGSGLGGTNVVGATAGGPATFIQPTGISAAQAFSTGSFSTATAPVGSINPAFAGLSNAQINAQIREKERQTKLILDAFHGNTSKLAQNQEAVSTYNQLQGELESLDTEKAARTQSVIDARQRRRDEQIARRNEQSFDRQVESAKRRQFGSEIREGVREQEQTQNAITRQQNRQDDADFRDFIRERNGLERQRTGFDRRQDNADFQQQLRQERAERNYRNQGNRFSSFASNADDTVNQVFRRGLAFQALFAGFEVAGAAGSFNEATRFAEVNTDPEKVLNKYLQTNQRIQSGFIGGLLGAGIQTVSAAQRPNSTFGEGVAGGIGVVGTGLLTGAAGFALTGSLLAAGAIATGGILGIGYLARKQREVEDTTNEALRGKAQLDSIDNLKEISRTLDRGTRLTNLEGFSQQIQEAKENYDTDLLAIRQEFRVGTNGPINLTGATLQNYNKAISSAQNLRDSRLRRVAINENRISQQYEIQAAGLFAQALGVPDETIAFGNLLNQQRFDLDLARTSAPATVGALSVLQAGQRVALDFQTGRSLLLRNLGYQAETDIANSVATGAGGLASERRRIEYERDRALVERPQDAVQINLRANAQNRAASYQAEIQRNVALINLSGQSNSLTDLINKNPLQAQLDTLRSNLQAALEPIKNDRSQLRVRAGLIANEGRAEQLAIQNDATERGLRLEALTSNEAVTSLSAARLPLAAKAQSIANQGLLEARALFEREGPERNIVVRFGNVNRINKRHIRL